MFENSSKSADIAEKIIGIIYIISLLIFVIGLTEHSTPYHKAINPYSNYDNCYTPFGEKHIITLIFYFFAFFVSSLLIWLKNAALAPLTLSLSMIFLLIGILISLVILYQLSTHTIDTSGEYYCQGGGLTLFLAPYCSICIGVYLIYKVTMREIKIADERTYNNKILNTLNTFLATKYQNPLWILILLFPVFFLTALILILFGQDTNSIVKVFTDTATWKLSQQAHPPFIDHQGHYLCTVAAKGNPKIVKPLRIGQRNGKPIIVNRQLLIANAFEEMIQDFSPGLHRLIRKNYDKYGFNLSQKINSVFWSNIIYILMKPLEWFFIICLYLFYHNPEQKINRQYT